MRKTTVADAERNLTEQLTNSFGEYPAFRERPVLTAIAIMAYELKVRRKTKTLLLDKLPAEIALSIIEKYSKPFSPSTVSC